MTDDPAKEALYASVCIAKYGGIVVLKDLDPTYVFPLLLQRLNIYTDPQRPMIVTPGIYPLNNPDENSVIAITTNFALTYFIVSGEIEGSKVPTWLLIKDTEGLSVMTAWAAGKFAGDDVATFIKKCGITDKAKTRTLIIPGYAAAISGDSGRGTAGLEDPYRSAGSCPYPGLLEEPAVNQRISRRQHLEGGRYRPPQHCSPKKGEAI